MISEDDAQKITQWSRNVGHDIFIDLVLNDDERSGAFYDFCHHLTLMVPKVKIKQEKDEQLNTPVIRIDNVRYQAIPVGRELEPFLDALAGPDRYRSKIPSSVQKKLENTRIPSRLKIYIMPHCPFCPKMVMQLLPLAAAHRSINLSVIDGGLFPEIAASDNIRSAPTLVLNDQYRWTGSVQIEEVVDMIINRDPSQLGTLSLETMLKEGNAAKVAEMMMERNKIFPAFMELLIHEKWPVRLAAMVVFETIAEKNQKLIGRTVPFLWDRFSQTEDTIKGDILYLLGKTGDKSVIPMIETVLKSPYPSDVIDAAAEALKEIDADE